MEEATDLARHRTRTLVGKRAAERDRGGCVSVRRVKLTRKEGVWGGGRLSLSGLCAFGRRVSVVFLLLRSGLERGVVRSRARVVMCASYNNSSSSV